MLRQCHVSVAGGMSKFCKLPRVQVQAVAQYAGSSDKPKAGAVKDEGGTFGKKGEADENAYFHKLSKEQLKNIKEGEDESKDINEKSKKNSK